MVGRRLAGNRQVIRESVIPEVSNGVPVMHGEDT